MDDPVITVLFRGCPWMTSSLKGGAQKILTEKNNAHAYLKNTSDSGKSFFVSNCELQEMF